ncbi:MAG: hypothetical protein AB4426_24150 [Xenococcaceae cyanobacterium]
MMSSLLQRVLNEIDQLTPEEQAQVMGYLAEHSKRHDTKEKPKRKLSEFYGVAPNLREDMDAQEWINRLRDEWEKREIGGGHSK